MKTTLVLLLIVYFVHCVVAYQTVFVYNENDSYNNFITQMFEDYNTQQGPTKSLNSTEPIYVNISIHIATYSAISVKTMDYKVDMYLIQEWVDERLKFRGLSEIELHGEFIGRLWLPDTFFPNSKAAHLHDVTEVNRIMRVSPNGHIYYNQRLQVTFACQMDLRWYPVDVQICPLKVMSYGHPANKLVYNKSAKGASMDKAGMSSSEFQYPTFTFTETFNTHGGEDEEFSTVVVDFKLRRQVGFFIVNCYLPFICITLISCLSPWISVLALPARATIGVVTILSIVVHNSGLQAKVATVSYMKAVDLYMIVSLLVVVLGLLEFIAAHQLHVRAEQRTKSTSLSGDNRRFRRFRLSAQRLDVTTRWFLPLAYLIFNILYAIVLACHEK